jgi:hypothetical protein
LVLLAKMRERDDIVVAIGERLKKLVSTVVEGSLI